MKKIILISCIILLSSISLLFALEEFSTEPISLDEFIDEYLPDYTLQKRIPLEGIGRAYAVAKDSGDIVAITEIGDQFKVHYFDIEGNLKWTKDFDKVELYGSFHKVKSMDCEISDNGETICLYISPQMEFAKPTGFYGIINTILSKKGNVLFTKILEGTWLIPSPDGKYLYKEASITSDYRTSEFELYKTNGTLVNIKGFDNFDNMDVVNVRLKFVSGNHILAYIAKRKDNDWFNYFRFLKLENENVATLCEYEVALRQDFDEFFNVKSEDNRIAICSGVAFSKLYVFDVAGNLLYFEDNSYQSFDFVNDNELFLQTHTAKGQYSKLINLSPKEVRKENITFRYEKYIKQIDNKFYDYDEFNNVLELNNLLLFSIKRYPYSKRNFYTIVLDMNDWKHSKNIEHNVDYIARDNEEFFVFEKYNENPEIVIIRGGEK